MRKGKCRYSTYKMLWLFDCSSRNLSECSFMFTNIAACKRCIVKMPNIGVFQHFCSFEVASFPVIRVPAETINYAIKYYYPKKTNFDKYHSKLKYKISYNVNQAVYIS